MSRSSSLPTVLTAPFLSVRDVRFARGRYGLMGAVVALICLLLVFLTGLTRGLAHQNTSAVEAWGAAAGPGQEVAVVFGAPHAQSSHDVEVSFTSSQTSAGQQAAWAASDDVAWAEPVGLAQTRMDSGTAAAAVALFGVQPGSRLAPAEQVQPVTGAVLSASAAEDLGVGAGDTVQVNGQELSVQEVVAGEYYSHSPVAWVPLQTWRQATHAPDDAATVIVAAVQEGTALDSGALAQLQSETLTVATDAGGALTALPSYSSENGSLVMMQAFLYGISALVIAAFMAVFTVQRTRDIAVLKALGATDGWVLTDGMVQAGIVLLVGAALGTGLGAGAAAFASSAVPVELSLTGVLLPFGLTLLLGLAAAAVAVWRTTRIDPLLALGGS